MRAASARRLGFFGSVALFLLATAPPAIGETDVIQPGDRMLLNGATQCTLSFVFDGVGADAGRVFMSIASHCVSRVGQAIDTDNFNAFGDVVLKGDASATASDIALIEVRPDFRGAVVPHVRGHPGLPSGVAHAGETSVGDRIVMSGWGLVWGGAQETREGREGFLLRHDAAVARIEGPVTNGDSGGPWTLADGRALAIVSKITATFSCCGSVDASVHEEGPTVDGIVAFARSNGLDIALRTA